MTKLNSIQALRGIAALAVRVEIDEARRDDQPRDVDQAPARSQAVR